MKRFGGIILLGLAAASLLSPLPAGAQKTDLKMMTGPIGGAWYPLGGALADLVQRNVPGVSMAISPGGGIANVEAIEMGKADLAFSFSSSGVDAVHGRPPFKGKMTQMRQLANLYPAYLQITVLDGLGIKSIPDLKGKAIAVNPKGNTGEFASQQVLQVHGLSYKDMSKVHFVSNTDAVALMKDGHCQAWLVSTAIPAAGIMDLASARKIRLLSLAEDRIKAVQALNPGYIRLDVPRGTYAGMDYDAAGIGFFSHVIVSAKMPEDLVYEITRAIVRDLPRLGDVVKDMKGVTAKDLALDIGIPFHPGALKYYREIKVLP